MTRLRNVFILIICLIFTSAMSAGDKSIVKIGTDVVVDLDETVESAVAIGGDVTIYGTVKESAVSIGGDIYVRQSGRIEDDAVSVGGKVLLAAGGEVEGDIVEVAAGSIGSFMHDFDHRFKWYYPWFFRSFSLIVLLLVSLVAVLLFPSIIEKASYHLESNPGKSMLFGILIMILFIPFIVILAISLLGIPLIPILVISYFLAYFLGYMAVGKVLGQRILVSLDRGPNTLIFRIFLGVVTIWVISLIPVIGGLLNLMIFVIGLGVLILSIKKGTDKVTQSSA